VYCYINSVILACQIIVMTKEWGVEYGLWISKCGPFVACCLSSLVSNSGASGGPRMPQLKS
jgi:hypothetical protein